MQKYVGVDSTTGKFKSGPWDSNDVSILSGGDGSLGDVLAPIPEDFEVRDTWDGTQWVAFIDDREYFEKRAESYPPIQTQLDMQYWDTVNGTTVWKDKISAIKAKFPKA